MNGLSRMASRTGFLLMLIMVILAPEVNTIGKTPVLFARGSHYEVGYEMGQAVKHLIKRSLVVNKALTTLITFKKTDEGQRLYTDLLAASKSHFPQYLDELRGVADGAEVDFDTVFLLMIQPEIDLAIKPAADDGYAPPGSGCSDFMVHNKDWVLHVHSEDLPPEIRYLGSIWVTEIIDKHQRIMESFIAFNYPGMIPGSAWTLNSHGLMQSGNIVFPRLPPSPGAVPRRIFNRALLTSSSIDDMITRLQTLPGIGSGFNYVLSERTCSGRSPDCISMVGIEIINNGSGGNTLHVQRVDSLYWHFNEYMHLEVKQRPDPSSRWRAHRVEEFQQEVGSPLSTPDHMSAIMSDQQNRKFPFFRDGAPPDYLATGSIAMADHYQNKLYIYKDKPAHVQPEVIFDLRPWHGRPLNLPERLVNSEPEVFQKTHRANGVKGAKSREEL